MNTLTHITLSAMASVPLKQYLHWDGQYIVIFIMAGALLDIDHIFYFIYQGKTFHQKQWITMAHKLRKKMQPGLYIFHSLEFNAILLALSFVSKLALVFMLANLLHLILDMAEHYLHHKNFSWLKWWSVVYWLKV